jgi:hypothetical protein
MPFTPQALDQFMTTYERNTASDDPADVVAQFADTFLAAGPDGSVLVSTTAFAQKLPMRKQHFENAGLRSTQLIARRDTLIGERYVLVDTQWQMDFAPAGKPAVTLTPQSSFLIDMGTPEPKILAYLSHQDIFKLIVDSDLVDKPWR